MTTVTTPMTEVEIEARYQSLFGHAAGYLPRDRGTVDDWQAMMRKKAGERGRADHVPSVRALQVLLENDPTLRDRVTRTIKEALRLNPRGIENTEQLLFALDEITRTAPSYRWNPKQRIYFPMSTLFCYMMAVEEGWTLFRDQRFNNALRGILRAWCQYLDSPESRHVLHRNRDGWLSRPACEDFKLYEFDVDWDDEHGGFTSYNDFFHRPIKPEFRPNDALTDPRAVVSVNDGSVANFYPDVQLDDDILDIKDQRYSLRMLLGGYGGTAGFVGGEVLQSFLSGANYHRLHAPVDGEIEYVETVEGLMFSELYSSQVDPSAGTLSQGYQANVNTRGIVVVNSTGPAIGRVGVVPVGITEISSVAITVEKGTRVQRGQEIGHFSYGGSSVCLVFEPDRVDIVVPHGQPGVVTDDGAPIFVNSTIARMTNAAQEPPRQR
ncbi:phosphatidylserine decarboxylase family protein [Actinophytocola oryzae]|uniref:Phosphatidylserine decarboxylase n=1 Tax=Actinophytocola oryzae TaxID=502181 RepID=A0A4V3FUS2_9PSEU|nr:phosphatidylserine decarboxylase family protein [Actinophytocola oryzae]TDV56351.1 phosphatidylserine decarboxylase [Actinophytocola oryzae]